MELNTSFMELNNPFTYGSIIKPIYGAPWLIFVAPWLFQCMTLTEAQLPMLWKIRLGYGIFVPATEVGRAAAEVGRGPPVAKKRLKMG